MKKEEIQRTFQFLSHISHFVGRPKGSFPEASHCKMVLIYGTYSTDGTANFCISVDKEKMPLI